MQDKITIADAPECLNTNDKAMWVLVYQAALAARSTCLHQIQEPAAAEQAAWHAGLDEGRAQAARPVFVPDDMPSTEANTKYGESYGVDWVYEGKTAAPAAVAVPMAEAWELSAADTEQLTTGAGQDYNQGVAEGLRICAKDLRAALAATPAAAPGKLGDDMQMRCRKCGEQVKIEFNSARIVTHTPWKTLAEARTKVAELNENAQRAQAQKGQA